MAGPKVFQPSATVPRNASVVTIDSVRPREKMSCFITFIPRETAVQIRYKIHARHGAKQDRKHGHHLRIQAQPVARKTNDQDRERGDDRALRQREQNREMKQRPAARSVAGRLGARDESDDRVVEAEHPDLAQHIGRRPRDEEGAERGRAQQSRDEKSENAAEIRGEKRDRVEEHPALQLRAVCDRRCPAPGKLGDGTSAGCGRSRAIT